MTDGRSDGDNVGDCDGAPVVGCSLGNTVGSDDTTGDGFVEGDTVGYDGLLVGLNDGSNVG